MFPSSYKHKCFTRISLPTSFVSSLRVFEMYLNIKLANVVSFNGKNFICSSGKHTENLFPQKAEEIYTNERRSN